MVSMDKRVHKRTEKEVSVKVGDVVFIQNDERYRGKWNVGIVVKLMKGKDGVVRAAKLRAGKSYLERAGSPDGTDL